MPESLVKPSLGQKYELLIYHDKNKNQMSDNEICDYFAKKWNFSGLTCQHISKYIKRRNKIVTKWKRQSELENSIEPKIKNSQTRQIWTRRGQIESIDILQQEEESDHWGEESDENEAEIEIHSSVIAKETPSPEQSEIASAETIRDDDLKDDDIKDDDIKDDDIQNENIKEPVLIDADQCDTSITPRNRKFKRKRENSPAPSKIRKIRRKSADSTSSDNIKPDFDEVQQRRLRLYVASTIAKNEDKYMCPDCMFELETPTELFIHLKAGHNFNRRRYEHYDKDAYDLNAESDDSSCKTDDESEEDFIQPSCIIEDTSKIRTRFAEPVECDVCEQKVKGYLKHFKTNHEGGQFKCPQNSCKAYFIKHVSLRRHMKDKHKIKSDNAGVKKYFLSPKQRNMFSQMIRDGKTFKELDEVHNQLFNTTLCRGKFGRLIKFAGRIDPYTCNDCGRIMYYKTEETHVCKGKAKQKLELTDENRNIITNYINFQGNNSRTRADLCTSVMNFVDETLNAKISKKQVLEAISAASKSENESDDDDIPVVNKLKNQFNSTGCEKVNQHHMLAWQNSVNFIKSKCKEEDESDYHFWRQFIKLVSGRMPENHFPGLVQMQLDKNYFTDYFDLPNDRIDGAFKCPWVYSESDHNCSQDVKQEDLTEENYCKADFSNMVLDLKTEAKGCAQGMDIEESYVIHQADCEMADSEFVIESVESLESESGAIFSDDSQLSLET